MQDDYFTEKFDDGHNIAEDYWFRCQLDDDGVEPFTQEQRDAHPYMQKTGEQKMTQQEFYNLPEIKECLDIQKRNQYGSKEHKDAYHKIAIIADKYGVLDKYLKAGGGQY